jgi:Na+-transporting NADH:ubiquinone oxidoreductase subunit C
MDTNSNKYTFIYSVIMVVVVAALLTVVALALQPAQQRNIELEKKRNILSSLKLESTPENVESIFDKTIVENYTINVEGEKVENVDAFKINLKDELKKSPDAQNWPLYVAKLEDGSTKYVFALYGKGLWGPIWGYISLNDDFTTVYGAYFDHKSETPGLGAEISTPNYQAQFSQKKIFDEKGVFVSVNVKKGGAGGDIYAVDAVSGGTITSNGLRDMLKTCISAYLKFIDENKK